MSAATTYFDKTMTLLAQLRERETANIVRAAELCADRIAKGGLVFLFGNDEGETGEGHGPPIAGGVGTREQTGSLTLAPAEELHRRCGERSGPGGRTARHVRDQGFGRKRPKLVAPRS